MDRVVLGGVGAVLLCSMMAAISKEDDTGNYRVVDNSHNSLVVMF